VRHRGGFISADVQAKWGAMASQGEIYSAWPFCMADEGVISQQGPPRMSPSGLESDCFLSRVLTKVAVRGKKSFFLCAIWRDLWWVQMIEARHR
jgi:hypothetical protein